MEEWKGKFFGFGFRGFLSRRAHRGFWSRGIIRLIDCFSYIDRRHRHLRLLAIGAIPREEDFPSWTLLPDGHQPTLVRWRNNITHQAKGQQLRLCWSQFGWCLRECSVAASVPHRIGCRAQVLESSTYTLHLAVPERKKDETETVRRHSRPRATN